MAIKQAENFIRQTSSTDFTSTTSFHSSQMEPKYLLSFCVVLCFMHLSIGQNDQDIGQQITALLNDDGSISYNGQIFVSSDQAKQNPSLAAADPIQPEVLPVQAQNTPILAESSQQPQFGANCQCVGNVCNSCSFG